MDKKNDIKDLVDEVDKKFKEIEQKKARVTELQKKVVPKKKEEPSKHLEKMKQQKAEEKFRLKEKFTHAAIVFVLGHVLLIPMYMKHSEFAPRMFLVASISLIVICVAVIDYT